MAVTRFYFPASGSPSVPNNPSFDGGWEQNGQAVRRPLEVKQTLKATTALANGTAITVPITTTQDYLNTQFISEPIRKQQISGTFSLVVRCFENANTNNVSLAVVVKLVSSDGLTLGATLFSNFNIDSEFPLSASAATRIVNAQAVTATTCNDLDRIIVEVGGHGTGPTAAGSYNQRFGTNAASDFALTSGLTTDLNPWCEFSQDLFGIMPYHMQFPKVGSHSTIGNFTR